MSNQVQSPEGSFFHGVAQILFISTNFDKILPSLDKSIFMLWGIRGDFFSKFVSWKQTE